MRRIVLTAAAVGVAAVAALPASASSTTIGNAPVQRSVVDTAQNFTIVDTNNPSTVMGTIAAVSWWAQQPGTVRFVLADQTNTVTWVSDAFTAAAAGPQVSNFTTPPGVAPGTNLGVYSPGTGVVSFDAGGTGTTYYSGENAGQPSVGSTNPVALSPRTYSMQANITPATLPVKDDCKDSGWQTFTASPGPFKNQGQCVSYFAVKK